MPQIPYTVRATLPTLPQRGRFLSWLVPDHILAVKAGGAEGVRVVLPDRAHAAAPAVVETQYVFPSRTAFDVYLRDHAPARRADGQKLFPPESSITSERQVAEIAGGTGVSPIPPHPAEAPRLPSATNTQSPSQP